MKNGNRYISDVIGDDYETWKNGDIILIKSPTGSGKSDFNPREILNAVSLYSEQNDIHINRNYSAIVREISRKVLDSNGECIDEELVEYTVSFVETDSNITSFALEETDFEVCETVEMVFSYNPFTNEVIKL